jgi:signal transduction histidine kinase
MKMQSRKAGGILILGGALIFFGLYYMINIIVGYYQYRITPDKKYAVVMHVQELISEHSSFKNMPLLSLADRTVRIHTSSMPSAAAYLLGPDEIDSLHDWLKKNPEVNHFAIPTRNNTWVDIDFSVNTFSEWLLLSFFILCAVLVLMYIMMVVSCVRRLSHPVNRLNAMGKAMQAEGGASILLADDIKEAQPIVRAINQLQVRIRTLLSDRTQMLAAISHDLRTPITRLKLRAENFQDSTQYEKILGDLAEMEHMIDSVLSFIQSESEEAPVKFDLAVLLETIVNDMQDAGFSVHYESNINNLFYVGQIQALKRAFVNLLDNAVKYGEGAVLNLSKKDHAISISIDDHGPGIPESEMQKVFQPFYRLDDTRNKEKGGTGLGLVIVKNILSQHHGDIQLINLPKGGLRVLITLLS